MLKGADEVNYVCFGQPLWNEEHLRRLLCLLPDGEIVFVNQRNDSVLARLDPEQTVALVNNPFWIRVINQFNPKFIVAIIPSHTDEEDTILWQKYWTHLAAKATMVCTDSERIYLEQCFRRDSVFFLHTDNQLTYDMHAVQGDALLLRDYEVIFRDAIATMLKLNNQSLNDLVNSQWRLRIDHYHQLVCHIAARETAYFLSAAYHYLLGESDARSYLLQSFEHVLLAGHANSLTTHYRFLSAIEAKAGELERAVSTYGITATQPEETAVYQNLLDLLERGERDMVQANLYLLNDDYKSAIALLLMIPTELARRTLFQAYMRMGELARAVQLVAQTDLFSINDRHDYCLLAGTVEAMKANRHEAIHYFLQAATYDYKEIAHILELRAVDERLYEMIGSGKA